MPTERANRHRDHRHRQQRPEREPRIDIDHAGQTENYCDDGIDAGKRTESKQLAHGLDVDSKPRHQIAGLVVLKIAERELLQMRKNFFAQIGFRFAGKTVDVDAPAVAKKALEDCRQVGSATENRSARDRPTSSALPHRCLP